MFAFFRCGKKIIKSRNDFDPFTDDTNNSDDCDVDDVPNCYEEMWNEGGGREEILPSVCLVDNK